MMIVGDGATGKAAVAIALTAAERRERESLARAHRTGQATAQRARIVLAAAAGLETTPPGATHRSLRSAHAA